MSVPASTGRILLRILRYVLPYKRNIGVSSAAMFLSVVFNMVTVILIIPFINVLFDRDYPTLQPVPEFSFDTLKPWALALMNNLMASGDPLTALKLICLMIVGSFLFKNVFSYAQTWFMAPAEQGIIRDLRRQLYEHVNRLSLSYFTEEKKGMLMSRIISDVQLVNDSAIAVVNSMFRDPPQIVIYTILLLIIDWQLTLIAFILLPTTGFVLTRIGNWVRRESDVLQEYIARLTMVLDEGLSSCLLSSRRFAPSGSKSRNSGTRISSITAHSCGSSGDVNWRPRSRKFSVCWWSW